MSDTWEASQSWLRRGRNFRVEVLHFHRGTDSGHHWCVYAYAYPSHPLFHRFKGEDMWQGATDELELHGGCTFCQAYRDADGVPVAWKVGCDYQHYGDERYQRLAPDGTGNLVFRDAGVLFDQLDAMATGIEA